MRHVRKLGEEKKAELERREWEARSGEKKKKTDFGIAEVVESERERGGGELKLLGKRTIVSVLC